MGIFKQKILFTKNECEKILESYKEFPISGKQIEKDISYSYKDMNNEKDLWILLRLIEWIENEIDVKIDWFNSKRKEFYLQLYKVGDKFGIHDDSAHDRIYGAGILLNEDFIGGEFMLESSKNKWETFEKIVGNCYLFESVLPHEVKEITEGNRHIILVFFKKNQVKSNKLKLI